MRQYLELELVKKKQPDIGRKVGKSSPMGERTKVELLYEAKKIRIKRRHDMTKAKLIDAIRNH